MGLRMEEPCSLAVSDLINGDSWWMDGEHLRCTISSSVLVHSLTRFVHLRRWPEKELAPGIGRLSRSQVYARRQLYEGRKTGTAPAKPETAPTKEVQVKGNKNGGSRLIPTSKRHRDFYPAEDVRKPKQSRKGC